MVRFKRQLSLVNLTIYIYSEASEILQVKLQCHPLSEGTLLKSPRISHMLLRICVLWRTYCRALGNPTLQLAILSRYLRLFVIILISKPVCVYMYTHVSVGACQFMYVGVSENSLRCRHLECCPHPLEKGLLVAWCLPKVGLAGY